MESPDSEIKKSTKTCPYCKLEVDAEATRCPHCHGKIKAKGKSKIGRYVLYGVLAVIVFVVIANALNPNPGSGDVMSGQQAYLRASSGPIVPVYASEQAMDEFTQDGINHDTFGQENLVDTGQAFSVPTGTQILVIGATIGTREVRILSGDRTGQSGYVDEAFVFPN